MLLHRIGNLAAAGTLNTSFGLGRLSHLLIVQNVAFVDADKLSVVLKSSFHEPKVLLNRVSCLALQGISDFFGGASQGLQVALNAATGITDYVMFALCVDIGNLDLRATQSTIEIIFETAATASWVTAVNARPDEPDFYRRTLQSSQLNNKGDGVENLFVYYAAGTDVPLTDAALNDVSITVEDSDGSGNCTLQEAIAYTAVFGQVEGAAPRNVFCFYDDHNDVTDDVSWQLAGSDADSDLNIIEVYKLTSTERLVMSVPSILAKAETKQQKFSPRKKAAMEMAGLIAGDQLTKTAKDMAQKIRNNTLRTRS